MSHEPQIQQRAAQHYAAIPATATIATIGDAVGRELPRLLSWLAASRIEPTGAPFIRYLVIDMMADLQIELAVPVGTPVAGDDQVRPGVLPEGEYAVLRHTGSYDGLLPANGRLLDWADTHGIEPDMQKTPAGEVWAGRLECYLTGPSDEADPAKWETDIAVKIR